MARIYEDEISLQKLRNMNPAELKELLDKTKEMIEVKESKGTPGYYDVTLVKVEVIHETRRVRAQNGAAAKRQVQQDAYTVVGSNYPKVHERFVNVTGARKVKDIYARES